jgi:hypothetical protein
VRERRPHQHEHQKESTAEPCRWPAEGAVVEISRHIRRGVAAWVGTIRAGVYVGRGVWAAKEEDASGVQNPCGVKKRGVWLS